MPVTTKDTSFTISPPYVAVNTITGDTYTALGQEGINLSWYCNDYYLLLY